MSSALASLAVRDHHCPHHLYQGSNLLITPNVLTCELHMIIPPALFVIKYLSIARAYRF